MDWFKLGKELKGTHPHLRIVGENLTDEAVVTSACGRANIQCLAFESSGVKVFATDDLEVTEIRPRLKFPCKDCLVTTSERGLPGIARSSGGRSNSRCS